MALLLLLGLCLNSEVKAYGINFSSFPLLMNKKLFSTEINRVFNNGRSLGVQIRYTHKLDKKIIFDTGMGIGNGERSSRIFLGVDYELYPYYRNQPRFSTKISYENAKEFNRRKDIFNIMPIISKGFNFGRREFFPFFALPLGMNLDQRDKTYQTMMACIMGINGPIPLEGHSHLTATLEGQVGLRNSFSSMMFSISLPLD